MTRIIATYDPPPIPTRHSDWSAVLETYDAGDPIGWGRTREEAVADLEEQITADAISQLDVTRAFVAGCVKRHQDLRTRNRHHMDELAFHWLAEIYERENHD